MELPELAGLPEKIGVVGTMLFAVFWLLWQNIRHEGGKALTPDSLSKRLAEIEGDIQKLDDSYRFYERKLERVVDKAHDFDTWKERMIVMWDRHQERTFRRQHEQRLDDRLLEDELHRREGRDK